jgi:outer membrane protein assembly factor BamB
MKKMLLMLVCLVTSLALFAQEAPAWKKKFDGKIKWYQLSEAGVVIVCSNDGLYGLKPEDGTEIWKHAEFDGIKEENYSPIDGSPFVAIVDGSIFNLKHVIINSVDGKIIARSRDLGIGYVMKRIECRKLGSLLFYGPGKSGKMTLVMVKFDDGSVVWEQQKLFEKNSEQIVSNAYVANDGNIFVATNKNIYKLNAKTGEVIYSVDMKSDLPPPPAPASGGLFGGAFSNKNATATATSTSADFFQYGDSSMIYFWNQDLMTALAVADGKEIWKRLEMKSPVGLLLHDKRGMILANAEKRIEDYAKKGGLFGGGNKDRAVLNLIDYKTGERKWSDNIKINGDVAAYKLSGNKLIIATAQDDGDNYISIVDLDAGKSITKKPMRIKGSARDLKIVPQGVYYRTSEEINILDVESGDKTWKKGFKVKNCFGANYSNEFGYVYGNGMIYKVDFTKGDLTEFAKDFQFEGKEEPNNMEIRDGGLLLTSSQNLTMLNADGTVKWHSYEKAPGRTLAGKLLSATAGVMAMSMAMGEMAQSAQLSYAKGYYGSTDPAVDNSIKYHNQMAGAWGNMAGNAFAAIGKRFKASKQANDYMSILTNFGTNNSATNVGIISVSKQDGKEGRKIIFGDKDPVYMLDEIAHMVYYMNEKDELTGYAF